MMLECQMAAKAMTEVSGPGMLVVMALGGPAAAFRDTQQGARTGARRKTGATIVTDSAKSGMHERARVRRDDGGGCVRTEGFGRRDVARGDLFVQARIMATAATEDEARAIASRVQVTATAVRVDADGPRNLGRRESWSVSYRVAAPRARHCR